MHFEFGQKIIDKIRGKKPKTIVVDSYTYENGNRLFYFDEEKVIINPSFKIQGLEINFHGKNSTIIIHSSNKFDNSILNVGDENFIIIKEDFYDYPYKHFSVVYPMAKSSRLVMGKNVGIMGCNFYLHDEPNTSVIIGDDCLFSFDNIIWPSDGHTILDKNGNVLNFGENIKIGNHVWVGMDCKILKGAIIPNNSVIGASSVYTKGSNSVVGGVFVGAPAKLVKKDICWDRKGPSYYKMNTGFFN